MRGRVVRQPHAKPEKDRIRVTEGFCVCQEVVVERSGAVARSNRIPVGLAKLGPLFKGSKEWQWTAGQHVFVDEKLSGLWVHCLDKASSR